MSVRLLLLLGLMLFSGAPSVRAVNFDPAHVAVFFANPYPLSPVKQLRGILMSLWAEADEALRSSEARAFWIEHHQQLFVEQLLDAHTLVDVLCVQGNQFKEDMRMLLQIASSLEKSMYRLIDGMKSDEVACMKIVFDRMKKKMEQIV
jgi:hypothetical protein